MTTNKLFSIILILISSALLLAGVSYFKPKSKVAEISSQQYMTALPQGKLLNEFSLTTHLNEPYHLHNLKGHWSIVFFGYSSCPTLCPQALDFMEQISNQLNDPSIRYLFITANPAIDTPERLALFMVPRPDNFVALTGPLDRVVDVAKQLGAYVDPSETVKDGHIAHTGSLFVINTHGEYVALISKPENLKEVIHELKVFMQSEFH